MIQYLSIVDYLPKMNVMGLEAVPTPVPSSEGNEDFKTTENFLDGVTSVDEMAAAFRQYAEANQTQNGSGAWEVVLPNNLTVLVAETLAAIESRNPDALYDAAMDAKLQELIAAEQDREVTDMIEGKGLEYLGSIQSVDDMVTAFRQYAEVNQTRNGSGNWEVTLPNGITILVNETIEAIENRNPEALLDVSMDNKLRELMMVEQR